MNRQKGLLSLIFFLLLPLTFALAQSADPFIGKWELSMSKSKFSPASHVKQESVAVTSDKTTVTGTDGQDRPFEWSFPRKNGEVVPIEGMENSSVKETVSGKTVDHVWKFGGGDEQGHGVISKNGKTLMYKQWGKNAEGQAVDNKLVFEKQ